MPLREVATTGLAGGARGDALLVRTDDRALRGAEGTFSRRGSYRPSKK
jgi:hypothetical protein